jgi:hypothetical protein
MVSEILSKRLEPPLSTVRESRRAARAVGVIRLLGAECQTASSFALAYPERRFEFVTDQNVADGWDLPNVTLTLAQPDQSAPQGLALCPRWLPADRRRELSLSVTSSHLATCGVARILPVFSKAGPTGEWQIKGDAFHRPDAPLSGTARSLTGVSDPHGCGLVYQPMVQARGKFLSLGRRWASGAVTLGVLEILAERFFRIDVLQAARTIDNPAIVHLTLAALDALAYEGFFSLNWLATQDGLRLTSFRPVPRAGLATLRRAGADLLAEPRAVTVAGPGHGFMSYPHYSSYQRIDT